MEVYGSFGDREPEPYASADEVVAGGLDAEEGISEMWQGALGHTAPGIPDSHDETFGAVLGAYFHVGMRRCMPDRIPHHIHDRPAQHFPVTEQ